MPIQIILFISGGGSNARQIISYFQDNEAIKVVGVLSSKTNEEMADFCAAHHVSFFDMSNKDFDQYLSITQQLNVDWVILAGFLKKVPAAFISSYTNRIINIHPSLLPKHGGAGMYGKHVHRAVALANEPYSGISIHLVNEEFDQGKILFQHAIRLPSNANADNIETLVRELEKTHFAPDIAAHLTGS
jgi:phosphoribosylglycinamide formyltransferase-1